MENALEEIKKSANPLQRIIDGIPTLAWRCHLDGSAKFLNQRWLKYTDLASEQPGECEARMGRYDGAYRWFLFRTVPLRDEHGNIIKWYGTNTDIEDLKRAECLLAAENRMLGLIANGD